jgi:hypothetical protein
MQRTGGVPRLISVAQPAPGAEITHTFARDVVLYGIAFTLATDVNAGNRSPQPVLTVGGDRLALSFQANTQPDQATRRWTMVGDGAAGAIGSSRNTPFGPAVVPAGGVISTLTGNIQAGDQFSDIVLSVIEF